MPIAEVAVVHHRTPALLERALQRLADCAPATPVLVLDTGPDAEPARRAAALHPRARVETIANHSYAAAVNEAIRRTRGERLAVMNADVLVEADTLAALDAPFADPDVALVGPLARTPDGRLQDQGVPYRWHRRPVVGAGPHAVVTVPWLAAFLFAVRRSAAHDVGGMDCSLRFFNEDLEWSLRLRRAGWRCRLVGAEVEHVGGAATPSLGRFWVEGLRGGMVVADRTRGPVRRELQRVAVGAFAQLRARSAPPATRPAWRATARMMRTGRYDVSPFGATLGDDAEGFPDAWPPRPVW